MFKKLLIICGIILLIVFLLFTAALVSLRLTFPPDKVKSIAIGQFEQFFHRKAEIGDLSVDLMKGVKINNVRISEKPDFDAGIFLQMNDFSSQFSIVPLLKGDMIINQIKFTEPRINIFRNRDGSYNFSDIFNRANAGNGSVSGTKKMSAVGLMISRILVERGAVVYTSPHTRIRTLLKLDNIELTIANVPFKKTFNFTSTFKTNLSLQKKIFAADSGLNGTYDFVTDILRLEKLAAGAQNGGLSVSGDICDLSTRPLLDLELIIDKTFLSDIAEVFSSTVWMQLKFLRNDKITLKIQGTMDNLKFSLG